MKSKFEIVEDKNAGALRDADLFFTSVGQRQALTAINNVIENRLDLLLLAGDEGTGKSKLISHSLKKTPDHLRVATASGKHDYPESFLRDIMFALDFTPEHEDVDALFQDLVNYLLDLHQTGRSAVLVIDKAEELSNDSIGVIKALSELESRENTLLRMIISSRKDTPAYQALSELIVSPEARARQIEIEPFSEAETRGFVLQLLREDPGTANLKLTTTGGRRIHYYSGGNPELISFLANLTSSITLGLGQSQITRKVVQRAIRSPKWVSLSESIPGIHKVKIPGSDERGQHASPKVIAFKNGKKLFEHELQNDKIWLGRDPSSSIQLPGASVSRRHALITREGDTIWISNLNSINGTQVNSKPVLRRVLLDGDVIRVADYLLLFIYEEAAKSSGHLIEAEALEPEEAKQEVIEVEEDLYTENYIELLDTPQSPITEFDMDYSDEPPSGGRGAIFTIGTIASIGLVTAAIIMSQQESDSLDTPVAPSIPPTNIGNNEGNATPGLNLPELPAVQIEAEVIEPVAPQAAPPAGQNIFQNRPAELPLPFATEAPPGAVTTVAEPQPLQTDSFTSYPGFTSAQEYSSPQPSFDYTTDSRYESGPATPEAGFSDLIFGAEPYAEYDTNTSVFNDRITDTSPYSYNDIEELLAQGNRQLAALKLTVPENDNAYATFQQVLAQEPGNPDAQAGIDRIVERYYSLAQSSSNRQNYNHARNMIQRGLGIQPWHQGLNDLQNDIAGLSGSPRRAAPRIQRAEEPTGKYQIAKATDSELNSLYSYRQPATIQRATPAEQVSGVQPLETSLDGFQPIFVTPQQPSIGTALPTASLPPGSFQNYQPPVSTYVAPTIVTPSPAPVIVQAPAPAPQIQQRPVASPQPQVLQPAPQTQTAARPAPAPAPAAPVAAAPAPVQQPVQAAPKTPAAPVKTAAAIIPDYLKNGAAATNTPTPRITPVSGETIMSVDYLLKQASRQQEVGHYTGPAGDNALETYKRVLALEPMNPDAMIGLLDIADYFYRESEKLLLLGDPLSSLAMIEQGLKVRPDHKGLRQLQTNAQLLLEKDGKNRATLYGKPLTTNQKKTAKIERQIDKIVNDARDRMNNQEYSQSLSLVEQGLKLDPQNTELISIRTQSLKSLAELEDKWGQQEKLREQNLARQQRVKYEVNEMKAQRLLSEARKEYVKGNYKGAASAIERGLAAMPENVELMALQTEVQEAWDKQSSKNAAKAIDQIVNGIVAKAQQAARSGDLAGARRLVDNGLALDPGNSDLRLLLLDLQKLELTQARN